MGSMSGGRDVLEGVGGSAGHTRSNREEGRRATPAIVLTRQTSKIVNRIYVLRNAVSLKMGLESSEACTAWESRPSSLEASCCEVFCGVAGLAAPARFHDEGAGVFIE